MELLANLQPETRRILATLATPTIALSSEHHVTITDEDFISCYKTMKEETSSSPSG
jgi:hypothetical protein